MSTKKKEVKTLYQQMVESFRNSGHDVNEQSWTERVGYDVPTEEYWFDVNFLPNVMKEGAIGYTSHFWFKDNLNEICSHSIYKNIYKIEEKSEKLV